MPPASPYPPQSRSNIKNEFSASVGGKIPFTKEKVFFFAAYDRFP